jgi:HEAT repeat protein
VKQVKWVLAIAGVAAAVIAAFMIWGRSSEPRWKGHSLSYWMFQPPAQDDIEPFRPDHHALAGIGSNAIPYLARWIDYESPGWRVWLSRRQRAKFGLFTPDFFTAKYADRRRAAAQMAFDSFNSSDTWAIPALTTIARSHNPSVWQALKSLGQIGPASVPALAEILSDRHASARYETLPWLDQFGSNAAPAIPALVAFCEEGPGAAQVAAPVLERAGAEKRFIVRAWTIALGEPPSVSLSAPPKVVFERLASYGTNAAPGVPALTRWLESRNAYAEEAAIALGRIGVRADIAVPVLMRVITDSDSACHYAAVDALGSFGPDARTAVPVLVACLKDPWVASVTARSLGQIRCDSATVVPALVDTLHVAEQSGWPLPLGEWTADSLGQFGPEAKSAVPALMECLHQEKAPVFEAARALRRIRVEPRLVVALLTNSLTGSPDLRNKALLGLGEFKDISPVALGAITNALADPDLLVRAGAETALKSRREDMVGRWVR